jgi:hypothetical protein
MEERVKIDYNNIIDKYEAITSDPNSFSIKEKKHFILAVKLIIEELENIKDTEKYINQAKIMIKDVEAFVKPKKEKKPKKKVKKKKPKKKKPKKEEEPKPKKKKEIKKKSKKKKPKEVKLPSKLQEMIKNKKDYDEELQSLLSNIEKTEFPNKKVLEKIIDSQLKPLIKFSDYLEIMSEIY